MKPKKLLFILPFFYGIGGVEKVLQQRLLFLSQHYTIKVIESNPDFSLPIHSIPSIEVIRLEKKRNALLQFILYIKTCRQIIQKFQPNAISVLDNGWKGLFVPWLVKNIPLFYEMHSVIPFKNKGIAMYQIEKTIYSLLLRNFDRLILLNQRMSNAWNHPQKKIIPNGITLTKSSFSDQDSKNILWVGRESAEKNLPAMLQIWEQIAEKHPDWKLLVYTPKEVKNSFFHQKKEHLRMQNVIGESDTFAIYSQGTIFCNTSEVESFGLSMIEAMHHGLAVISFDVDFGPRNILDHEKNGILVPSFDCSAYANQLDQFMTDPQKRQKFAIAAFEKSLQFNVQKIHEDWLQFYA